MSTTSQSNLEGQRAVVAGATSGIGRAVVLQLVGGPSSPNLSQGEPKCQ